jgi:ABC-type branched-subunit amino acid transport system ATPase component
VAVLLVEHHLEFAYAVADTVTILRDGRQMATRVATEVQAAPPAYRVYAGAVA